MVSKSVAVNRVFLCALAACGWLNACGQKSPIHLGAGQGSGGSSGSGNGGLQGGAALGGMGGAPLQEGGGRGGPTGGAPSGSQGGGGAAQAEGGAVPRSGGASQGGSAGGVAGAGGEGGKGSAGQPGGTGTGVAGPAYFHAGTRLKPRVLRGGGLEVLDTNGGGTWYDVETGEWCVFRAGADGVERCFPNTGSDSNDYYLDRNCTKRVLVGSNLRCDGTPYHYLTIGSYSGFGCDGITYKLGAALAAGTKLYSNAADHCVSRGASTEPVYPLQKAPLETFVAVQGVSRPRSPNMNAWVREGADGSSEVIGFYDSVRQAPCSGLGPDVSSDACVPTSVEVTDTFSDSACAQRVGYDNPVVCRPPLSKAFLALDYSGDACTSTQTIHGLWEIAGTRRGEVFDLDPFDGTCTTSSIGPLTVYAQGAPIDVASLPKLQVIQAGTGSLRLPFYGFDNVPFFPTAGATTFVEAASGNPCQALSFADGTWRCASSTFELVADYDLYYQSADCTGERLYPWAPSGACSDKRRQPVGVIFRPFGGCGLPNPVTETLLFEEPSAPPGPSFHPTPFTACQMGAPIDDHWKGLRATKAVNPADLFIPFERKLLD